MKQMEKYRIKSFFLNTMVIKRNQGIHKDLSQKKKKGIHKDVHKKGMLLCYQNEAQGSVPNLLRTESWHCTCFDTSSFNKSISRQTNVFMNNALFVLVRNIFLIIFFFISFGVWYGRKS